MEQYLDSGTIPSAKRGAETQRAQREKNCRVQSLSLGNHMQPPYYKTQRLTGAAEMSTVCLIVIPKLTSPIFKRLRLCQIDPPS